MPPASLRIFATLALAIAATGCAAEPAPPAPVVPIAAPTATTSASASSGGPAPAPLPVGAPLRLLYADGWHGSVQLLGIDAVHERAFLRLEAAGPRRLAIDTIDFRRAARVDRWEATQLNADATVQHYPVFRPLTGKFDDDLARFAMLLRAAGPWHLRGSATRPTIAASGDGSAIAFGAPATDGSDGEWLFLADGAGHGARRLDAGMRASYAAVFSPDGRRLAWRGCVASPCGYGLYLSRGAQGHERAAVIEAGPPTWSADGRSVLVVGRAGGFDPARPSHCLYRVPADAPQSPTRLKCIDGRDVEFVQDPSGRTGVLAGTRGLSGTQFVQYLWLLLDDGSVLADRSVDRASGVGLVNDAGLLVVPMQKGGLAAIDLVGGQSGILSDPEGWYLGLETTRWLGDWIVALRRGTTPAVFQLVAVDARTLAGSVAPRPSP